MCFFAGKHCGKGGQMFMEIDLLIHFCPDILFTPDDTDACLSDTLLRGMLAHHLILPRNWEGCSDDINQGHSLQTVETHSFCQAC